MPALPPLADLLVDAYRYYSLVGGVDALQGYVVLAPEWHKRVDWKDDRGQIRAGNVKEWVAAIGQHRAEGTTPQLALVNLLSVLEEACRRTRVYHTKAGEEIDKELAETG